MNSNFEVEDKGAEIVVISEGNRSADGEFSSRELLRSRRL